MKRTLCMLAVLGTTLAIAAPNAHAALSFKDLVNFNLSVLGLSFSDAEDVYQITASGAVFTNGDESSNGGTFGVGTLDRTVGYARSNSYLVGGPAGTDVFGSLGGAGSEFTLVMKDWDGTITEFNTPSVSEYDLRVTYDTYDLGAETGLLKLYVDSTPDYSTTDATKSANGEWVATFGLTNVQSQDDDIAPTTFFQNTKADESFMGTSSYTDVGLILLEVATDIFGNEAITDTSGNSALGQLAMFINTTNTPQTYPGDGAFSGIWGAGGDPVDLGTQAGYNPATLHDHYASFTGSAQFAIPEPASILVWAGLLGLIGVVAYRRRNTDI